MPGRRGFLPYQVCVCTLIRLILRGAFEFLRAEGSSVTPWVGVAAGFLVRDGPRQLLPSVFFSLRVFLSSLSRGVPSPLCAHVLRLWILGAPPMCIPDTGVLGIVFFCLFCNLLAIPYAIISSADLAYAFPFLPLFLPLLSYPPFPSPHPRPETPVVGGNPSTPMGALYFPRCTLNRGALPRRPVDTTLS